MGHMLIVFGERRLDYCIQKRMETFQRALGLGWDDIESGTLILLDYIHGYSIFFLF